MGVALTGRGRGAEPMAPAGGTGYYRPTGYQPMTTQGGGMLQQLNSLFNLGQLANAPQTQAINNNIASYMKSLDLLRANQQTQTGYTNQDLASQLAGLGIDREGLGIQQGANDRAKSLLPQQHQLALEGFGQREEEAKFGHERGVRQLQSDSTVRGSTVSQGHRQGLSDLATQLMFSMRDIGRGRQGENLDFGERMAQLGDRDKQLSLAGKSLGLQEQEFRTRASRALSQLGLDTALGAEDIARAINDQNAGRWNPVQSLLGLVYQYSGLRPTG